MATPYRVPVLEEFEWQQPVISNTVTTPPVSPAKGDRYLISSGATGDWSAEVDNIAYCSNATGPVWSFTDAKPGMIVWIESKSDYYHYTGSEWVLHGSKEKDEAKRYALLVGAP